MIKSTKKRNQADIADNHQEETVKKTQIKRNFDTRQESKTFLNLCKDKTKSGYKIYNIKGKTCYLLEFCFGIYFAYFYEN